MSMHDRAAQFSPFAALTGYESCIEEAARLVDARAEISDDTREKIDRCLAVISGNRDRIFTVRLTYFLQDSSKDGGEYRTHTGDVKKTDTYNDLFVFTDGKEIKISDISNIEIVE